MWRRTTLSTRGDAHCILKCARVERTYGARSPALSRTRGRTRSCARCLERSFGSSCRLETLARRRDAWTCRLCGLNVARSEASTVFGLGSVLGMTLVSVLIGLPFTLAHPRLSRAARSLETLTGLIGVCFGCWYAARILPGI